MTGVLLRYAPRELKSILCSPLTHYVPLQSSVPSPPESGVFLTWSPSLKRRHDAAHEAEQMLALTYAPGHWHMTEAPPSGTLIDNEGRSVKLEGPHTRVWPAFGQSGGDFEVIWKCAGQKPLTVVNRGSLDGGTVFGPFHGDSTALWRLGAISSFGDAMAGSLTKGPT